MIDWDRVNALREEVGEDDFAEVVDMFLEEAEDLMQQIVCDPKEDQLESRFHALKGSALNLGLDAFAAICSRHEVHAKEGSFDQIDIGATENSYNESKALFCAHYRPSA